MADDQIGRRLERFLADLGDATVPTGLADTTIQQLQIERGPASTRRQPLLIVAVGFVLLAGLTFTVLSGQQPEPTPNPSMWVVEPSAAATSQPSFESTETPSASPPPSPEPSEPLAGVCGEVIAATEPRGVTMRPLAVYSTADGIGIFDVDDDTTIMYSEPGRLARFRTPTLVTIVRQRLPPDEDHTFGQDSLYELDVSTGRSQEFLRLPNHVLTFEWSPDGATLAYLVEPLGDNVLCRFDSRSGVAGPLRTMSFTIGRGGNQRDERAIAWSASGQELLVLDTVQQPSTYVVDLDGRDVVSPFDGTFARWWSASEILFASVMFGPGSAEALDWSLLSLDEGRTRDVDLPPDAYRPAISPDGRSIAYDDGAEEPSVLLFNVESGASRRLARNHVAPLWLRPDLVAATAAVKCPPGNFCTIPWLPSNSTLGIDPASGDRRALALPTTLELFGTIDVLMP